MTDAQHWLFICETRMHDGHPSFVEDPWCVRLLAEAAADDPDEPRTLIGARGRMWTFSDGSRLVAHPEVVYCLPAEQIASGRGAARNPHHGGLNNA